MRTILLAAAALIAAAPAAAQVMAPADYVKAAGASDLYERTSSQVVLQTTRNAQVREFAQMMIGAHAKSTAQVKAAAMKAKVPVAPPMLAPKQQAMVDELKGLAGEARDARYIAQQKMAHQEALAVQQDYASAGTAAPLKAAAAGIVPVVQHHIEMLSAM